MEKSQNNNMPWERQEDETEKAYQAFVEYRELGLGRTFIAVAEKLRKSDSLIRRWKEKYNWEERVKEYDTYIERQTKEQAVKDYKSMTERHIRIAMQLQKAALEALKAIDTAEMSFKDIKEYIKLATELERESRTLETENEKTETEANLADMIVGSYMQRSEDEI